MDVIRHIRQSPVILGLSGGEPLLLGPALRKILDMIEACHPTTRIDVLTNARLFNDHLLAGAVLSGLTATVTWLVPLYGHAAFLHDFVVQASGAFEETVSGLLTLQANRQSIQLRTVLIEPVLAHLPALCGFIGRNLPFVREVALMGCEPIGFALANREQCEVDLGEWQDALLVAAQTLRRHAVPFVWMNVPLCTLPRSLWPQVALSISDWKNVYAPGCDGCAVKTECPGLFAWHERGWKPGRLIPILE
jgi:His-Xaa-Ser system radical SAM maturase HxsC